MIIPDIVAGHRRWTLAECYQCIPVQEDSRS